ncbi:hypothetical protein BJI67_15965 (plasmid) [Acidihalobacter aeolianus]|uniref:Uncharacterized protein n=1 Tax=Acidihalobacter aeolianus TaxID=2792603 RepID=A0A1D8KCP7_9GAMM|nr:hypothetical protein [Acidihalobacter aeolianus]AOV18738.1 hypothetical protein BJI67_15965 [Acidihalobacter aeolianus]
MSWRETLGAPPSTERPYTHNSQNTQKHTEPGNCADIADSAYRDSKQESSKLLEALADACRGLAITPTEVKLALAAEDIDDWRNGTISTDTLAAFAHSLVQRRDMDQGKCPDDYTETATCKHCGPIWLWFSGEVLGCPWCWNRAADKPIPRPCSVHCGDCIHFKRINHPHLGHCSKGEPEAIAGLWDMDRRYCECFLPRPQQTHNDQPRPPRADTKR